MSNVVMTSPSQLVKPLPLKKSKKTPIPKQQATLSSAESCTSMQNKNSSHNKALTNNWESLLEKGEWSVVNLTKLESFPFIESTHSNDHVEQNVCNGNSNVDDINNNTDSSNNNKVNTCATNANFKANNLHSSALRVLQPAITSIALTQQKANEDVHEVKSQYSNNADNVHFRKTSKTNQLPILPIALRRKSQEVVNGRESNANIESLEHDNIKIKENDKSNDKYKKNNFYNNKNNIAYENVRVKRKQTKETLEPILTTAKAISTAPLKSSSSSHEEQQKKYKKFQELTHLYVNNTNNNKSKEDEVLTNANSNTKSGNNSTAIHHDKCTDTLLTSTQNNVNNGKEEHKEALTNSENKSSNVRNSINGEHHSRQKSNPIPSEKEEVVWSSTESYKRYHELPAMENNTVSQICNVVNTNTNQNGNNVIDSNDVNSDATCLPSEKGHSKPHNNNNDQHNAKCTRDLTKELNTATCKANEVSANKDNNNTTQTNLSYSNNMQRPKKKEELQEEKEVVIKENRSVQRQDRRNSHHTRHRLSSSSRKSISFAEAPSLTSTHQTETEAINAKNQNEDDENRLVNKSSCTCDDVNVSDKTKTTYLEKNSSKEVNMSNGFTECTTNAHNGKPLTNNIAFLQKSLLSLSEKQKEDKFEKVKSNNRTNVVNNKHRSDIHINNVKAFHSTLQCSNVNKSKNVACDEECVHREFVPFTPLSSSSSSLYRTLMSNAQNDCRNNYNMFGGKTIRNRKRSIEFAAVDGVSQEQEENNNNNIVDSGSSGSIGSNNNISDMCATDHKNKVRCQADLVKSREELQKKPGKVKQKEEYNETFCDGENQVVHKSSENKMSNEVTPMQRTSTALPSQYDECNMSVSHNTSGQRNVHEFRFANYKINNNDNDRSSEEGREDEMYKLLIDFVKEVKEVSVLYVIRDYAVECLTKMSGKDDDIKIKHRYVAMANACDALLTTNNTDIWLIDSNYNNNSDKDKRYNNECLHETSVSVEKHNNKNKNYEKSEYVQNSCNSNNISKCIQESEIRKVENVNCTNYNENEDEDEEDEDEDDEFDEKTVRDVAYPRITSFSVAAPSVYGRVTRVFPEGLLYRIKDSVHGRYYFYNDTQEQIMFVRVQCTVNGEQEINPNAKCVYINDNTYTKSSCTSTSNINNSSFAKGKEVQEVEITIAIMPEETVFLIGGIASLPCVLAKTFPLPLEYESASYITNMQHIEEEITTLRNALGI